MVKQYIFAKAEYERRVLQTLRNELVKRDYEDDTERSDHITVEDIRLHKSKPDNLVIILFRDKTRSHCLFGYRSPIVEDNAECSADFVLLDPSKGYWGPEEWASTIIATHFEEQIWSSELGLPSDCEPNDMVTWIDNWWLMPSDDDDAAKKV